jgi:hypothetical protein
MLEGHDEATWEVATVGIGINGAFPDANEIPLSARLAVVGAPTPFAVLKRLRATASLRERGVERRRGSLVMSDQPSREPGMRPRSSRAEHSHLITTLSR